MYIDPNTGGFLAQALLVVFTALSGVVLVYSNKIKMFFAKMKRNKEEDTTEETQD